MSFMVKKHVEVYSEVTEEMFETSISPKRMPAIIRKLDIGRAPDKWTPQYLSQHGADKSVKVHVCPTGKMDFIHKNFAYKSLPFSQFVKRASEDVHEEYFFCPEETYYLRSLGDDPRKDISDLTVQFPSLAQDINIPKLYPDDRFFSSVFRISSPSMQLWTHYDIMDNLLIQVTGKKRVVLFSPRDATKLYLNGDKSEVLDIDNPDLSKYPKFIEAVPYECFMEPGDVLFIPALWFHNVTSLQFGVAVNVFWHHLDPCYYDNKDTYGNKDLVPATRAMQIMDRAIKALEELPEEYKDFYARRIVSKVKDKCYVFKNNDSVRKNVNGNLDTEGSGRTKQC
ncbi:tRNA wybutosine-synthesizing protein 5-like [Montipora foliosa]|uniref:tRNA wybutosine-synthesizing protein 5-like n=1 Tax=Montipora foliosa TaxID=591990 RepID=UPI0035F1D7B5